MDCQRCNGTIVAKPAIACQSSVFRSHLPGRAATRPKREEA